MIDDERPVRKRTKLGVKDNSQQQALNLAAASNDVNDVQRPQTEDDGITSGTRDREANKSLQGSFALAVAAGTITALLGYFPDLKWLGLVGPLAAITVFFLFGKARGFDGRSDTRQQFADSCYFLGFLLTMIAMLAGFLPAGMFDQEITSQGILRHFSMALGATALGLIFRILALQGARSFNHVASEIETTLTLYARRVSQEAELIGDHLADLRLDLDQQRARVAGTIVEEVRDAVLAAVKPIQEASAAISASLVNEAERMAIMVGSVQRSLSDSAAQIASVADLRDRVDKESNDALVSVEQSIGAFNHAVAELGNSLSTAASGVTMKMDAVASTLDRATASLPGLQPAIDGLTERLQTTEASFAGMQRGSNELATRIETAVAEDGRVLRSLDAAQGRIIEQIDTAGERVAGTIMAANEHLGVNLASELSKTSDLAKARSDEFQTELTNATDRLALILRNFATKIDAASQR